jgi:methylated-DNA-[protein]-cysteine S-methyltransferase
MELKIYTYYFDSPLGFLKISTDTTFLLSINFESNSGPSSSDPPRIMNNTIQQLKEYFNGSRKVFNLKLNPSGTEFQKNTWEQVKKIPYGKTTSYLNIAIQTGSENNTRAVGTANGKNKIPIIIPCHRIIDINGKLTGYSGGIDKKKWLLNHERAHSVNTELLF